MQTRRCYGTVREGIAENVVVAMVENAFFAADVDEIATWTDSAIFFLRKNVEDSGQIHPRILFSCLSGSGNEAPRSVLPSQLSRYSRRPT